jgi:5-methylcytosine-specific restriction enzyme subunit McrC
VSGDTRILELVEYETKPFARHELEPGVAEALWHSHGKQVAVTEPSFKNDHQWELTPQGYVGYIPLTSALHLALRPKVPLDNLFHMLEYAYKLGKFLKTDMVRVESFEELYERLALVLAQRVLDRARKGLYRGYVDHHEQVPFLRGRMDLQRLVRAPWEVRPSCHYQEHTADVEENQILAWTLFLLPRTGLCRKHSRSTVTQAFRAVGQAASLEHVTPQDCLERLYHRLNEDYQPLHALCHFFLAHIGPSYRSGRKSMLPFLINMNELFEVFVAEWLTRRGLEGLRVKPQHRITWDEAHDMRSQIDLVLTDKASGRPRCVLDTKYKRAETPAESDIHQAVFYALATGCREAVLVYPAFLSKPIDTRIDHVHLRTLTFGLDGDLDEAGERFVRALLEGMPEEPLP